MLALTLHIELFTQAHYRESIRDDAELSELFKDVFRFHWKEECQHAIIDELEWRRIDAGTTPKPRDQAVDELIELVGAVDAIVQAQAAADSRYFVGDLRPAVRRAPKTAIGAADAARGLPLQYILSGARHPHFADALASLTTDAQLGASRRRSPPCTAACRLRRSLNPLQPHRERIRPWPHH